MNYLKELLSETGTASMTRFMSLLCVLAALIISISVVYKGQSLDSAVGLVSVFLAAAFGGKVMQKHAEVKSEQVNEDQK
jgi:hypothetical protein